MLADGDSLQRRFINIDSQTRSGQRGSLAASAEGEVLNGQTLADEMAVVASFEVTNVRDRGREVTAGGGKNSGLSDLAAELITESRLMCDRGETQRRDQSAAL